jgi:hypothetical protein
VTNAIRLLPSAAVRCNRGEYLLRPSAEGIWTVWLVEDFVALSRLLPIGDRDATEFIEQRLVGDSEPPAGSTTIYLLLTLFGETFSNQQAAIEAIESAALSIQTLHVCADIDECPASTTIVYARKSESRRSPT